jgi:uncharacterized OB-fold protein
MAQVPIAGGMLALEPGAPRLLASRCDRCGALAFPVQSGCARCGSTAQETVRLAPAGKIWTWTSQEFRPVSPPYTGPETFTPYYVGFVEVAEGLCVETRLTGFGDRPPRIGQQVSLVALPFRTDDDGNEVVVPAFEPAPGGSGA